MTSLNDIRSSFLSFFERHDHKIMKSAPLVPEHDPTLLFVNAGMVPFKDIFTGKRKPQAQKATSAQKCVRAGGKHNDLDHVGYTARHHTFFEMLGNFSFGDYFKERAIKLAWTFLMEEMELSSDRLWITVYHQDEEAFELWRKISGLADNRIIRIASSDNFWSMGQVGPCGPCSEIFYDHGEHIAGGLPGSASQEGDRFTEIWNLVFMQFERQADGREIALPRPSIDTGMGLERMAAVMQGTYDNYETDLFKHLIAATEEALGCLADKHNRASFRVIADHLRAICFLIADGVLPSNEGRGYVLRRILRRAMRQVHFLGREDILLYRLVPALKNEMGEAYPELIRASEVIAEVLKNEEERFKDMLHRGMGLLEKETVRLKRGQKFSGEIAFRLYDTYGFPLDLTQDALRRAGYEVNVSAFDKALAAQRDTSRSAWKGSGDQAADHIWLRLADRYGPTKFLGYSQDENEAEIIAIVKEGKAVDRLAQGEEGAIILDQTAFYAESGGQVGDHGILSSSSSLFRVNDTQKQASLLHAHLGRMEKGSLKKGDRLTARIDEKRRNHIRANHSATHLLHQALRQTLGLHVAQKGSLVDERHLRFDFSHAKPLTAEEISNIEKLVNEQIRDNALVVTKQMKQEEALRCGALAMFGEKYDDDVRVLFMGGQADKSQGQAFSIEFCGGTHVQRMGDIALLKIIAQSAVGAGIRRVIALTGELALDHLVQQEKRLLEGTSRLKVPVEQFSQKIDQLLEENKRLTHSLREAKQKLAFAPQGTDNNHIETIASVKFMHRIIKGMGAKELRTLVDEGKKQLGSGIVAMIGLEDDRAALTVGITKDLTQRYDAIVLVKIGATLLGGSGGGGRLDMAQAGGPNGDKAKEAIEALRQAIGTTF